MHTPKRAQNFVADEFSTLKRIKSPKSFNSPKSIMSPKTSSPKGVVDINSPKSSPKGRHSFVAKIF